MNELERAEIGLAQLDRWLKMAADSPAPPAGKTANQPHSRPSSAKPSPVPAPTGVAAVGKTAHPANPDPQTNTEQPLRPPPPPEKMNLAELATACAGCHKCGLANTRTRTVFGIGKTTPGGILLVGEGPGEQEDIKGEPFVGPAGRLLDAMLAAIGIERGQVYIANVVKCRPPGNRNPAADEIAACLPYLQSQIRLLQPRLIVALGKVAANALLATDDVKMAAMRGRMHQYDGIDLLVTYHPSYYLHQPQQKIEGWKDLVKIRKSAAAGTPR